MLEKVIDSYLSFDDMYDSLINGDFSILDRKCGTSEYPQIEWMIEFFEKNEEYEKCDFLKKLKLPEVCNNKILTEIEWLKLNKYK